MKLSRPVFAAAVLAALASACGSAPAPGPVRTGHFVRGVAATEPAVSPVPYATADLTFGLSLLSMSCAQDPAGNLVLSPSSLASGLGMAYLGARGDTARAMSSVLHLPAGGAAAQLAGLHARSRALRRLDGPGVTVVSSDQLWADPKLPALPGYLNAIATGYGAGLGQVPLLRAPARAAEQIDAAIAAATRGHVRRLLSPDDLQDTIFVLTDALYLNAKWATAFKHDDDVTGGFATAAGHRVTARYMFGTGYPSAVADDWTAVKLPYRGGRLAMTALLPPPGQPAACQVPAASDIAAITHALRKPTPAAVEVPKVNLKTKLQLNDSLKRLGMGVAFAPNGDFSGLSPQAAGIGVVVHAATLRVDEAGTVGSAATGVTIQPTAGFGGPMVQFTRPYLMLVTDTRTGEPLFLARVANPDQA